jgi:hypothetical protein
MTTRDKERLRQLVVETANLFRLACSWLAEAEDIAPLEAAKQAMNWVTELVQEATA